MSVRKAETPLVYSRDIKKGRIEIASPRLPNELWQLIFSNINNISDLACVSQVCWNWNFVVSDDLVWKSLFRQRFGEDCTEVARPFASKGWKKVFSIFCALHPCKDAVFGHIESNRVDWRGIMYLDSSSPFVHYGQDSFYISKDQLITGLNSNATGWRMNSGNWEQFTYLTSAGKELIGVTALGVIVFWDISTRNLKKRIDLQEEIFVEELLLHRDLIYIFTQQQCLVIHKEDPTNRAAYNLGVVPCCRTIVLHEKLYVLGENELVIWHLRGEQGIERVSFKAAAPVSMAATRSALYFATPSHIYSIKSGEKEAKLFKSFDGYPQKAIKLHSLDENTLIYFCTEAENPNFRAMIIDIPTQSILYEFAITENSLKAFFDPILRALMERESRSSFP